ADDLHLELFPAEDGLLEQDFGRRRLVEAAADDLLELLAVVRDASAAAAQRERRADDDRKADLLLYLPRLLERVRDAGAGDVEADLLHRVAELLAVLGHVDRLPRRGDQLDAVFLEDAVPVEVERAVERGLPAHRRQQRRRAFFLDDARDGAPVDRLDVDRVRARRIGHDRRRIRVHEDDAIALLLERLAGLRARVIELARLADDDRAGSDDQNAFEVVAARHTVASTVLMVVSFQSFAAVRYVGSPHSWTNPASARTERAARRALFQERRESIPGGSARAIPGAHGPGKAHVARHAPSRRHRVHECGDTSPRH